MERVSSMKGRLVSSLGEQLCSMIVIKQFGLDSVFWASLSSSSSFLTGLLGSGFMVRPQSAQKRQSPAKTFMAPLQLPSW